MTGCAYGVDGQDPWKEDQEEPPMTIMVNGYRFGFLIRNGAWEFPFNPVVYLI